MVFDRTENEPEEWDPEEEFYDPESDSLTIPQVSIEDDGPDDDLDELTNPIRAPTVSTGEMDVPDEILQTFWVLVVVLNAAVLLVSLGLLFLIFEGNLTRGGPLVGGGLVLLGLAGRRYRRFRAGDYGNTAGTDGSGTDTAADGGSEDTEPTESTTEGSAETPSRDGTQE
ncbi:DUF7322 domain-containing protein [Natrinema longum]|uniref:DUF7322 domain-containing protein n=1 Tax=Natrinema longum TaxID=370324 RepID=A0A8A2UAF6_9EURY|nr:hypothetical protein [Natrinema longum]MBZ6496349.1 hypothetical protein [Natrinema longum]QSW85739.1 hypothetical protein J0X27_02560 [Natrinema longum]